MTQRTKLLLLIPHLGGGGAERVAAQLARHLDPHQFEIHLGLIAKDSPGAQPIPRWVQVHRLQRKRVRHAWFRLIRLIHAERPDVVLSGMAHLNFLLLLLKPLLPSRTRILVRQNTTASAAAQTWFTRFLYRYLYRRAHAVICQSRAMAADLADRFAIPRAQLKILSNPVDTATILASSPSIQHPEWPANAWPRLLSIGRLAREKGIDLLLYALSEIREHHPCVHLQILGVGPEEAALRKLSLELGLEDAVSFLGFQEDLASFYKQATLFILPSRYEGMPNALLEAAAAGLPLVATPSSAGLCDLLENAPGAWLTQSISAESLAETILEATQSLVPSRDSEPQRFRHGFLVPYETPVAIAAYAALIQSLAKRPPA